MGAEAAGTRPAAAFKRVCRFVLRCLALLPAPLRLELAHVLLGPLEHALGSAATAHDKLLQQVRAGMAGRAWLKARAGPHDQLAHA